MGKRVRSKLKEILDSRDISIRQLAEMTKDAKGEGIKFETLRRLYHDTTKQYQRETIGKVCEALNIELAELLELEDYEDNTKPTDQ